MQAKTPKQVLQAIHWIIKNVGWNKGNFFIDKTGSSVGAAQLSDKNPPAAMCIRGAWHLVEADFMIKQQAWVALCSTAPATSPISFNDSPHTSKSDVLNLIQSAKHAL